MKNLHIVVILTLTVNLYSQERCYDFNGGNNKINAIANRDVKYNFSTGLCYHFNSSSIDIGYKRNLLTVITMTVSPLRGTIRMKDEFYVGYTHNIPIGRKENINIGVTSAFEITTHKPVGRLYVDRRLYKGLFLHGSTIQVGTGMNHLIGGIKISI
jgi:hypothetical protein